MPASAEASVPNFLWSGPERAAITLALAHGAGAPMDHPFMEAFAAGLGARGIRVARFEFPYMAKRRVDGKKRGPNKLDVLKATWTAVIDELGPARLVIGGKSMGGRVASLIAAERSDIAGLVCLGYPFHPTGKPDKLRVEHLPRIQAPTLIVQGSRDPMGNRAEVEGYGLPAALELRWLEDGDHGFKPRKRSGFTQEQHWATGVDWVARFCLERAAWRLSSRCSR